MQTIPIICIYCKQVIRVNCSKPCCNNSMRLSSLLRHVLNRMTAYKLDKSWTNHIAMCNLTTD